MPDKIKITYVDSEDKRTCYLTREQSIYFGLGDTVKYIILTMGLASVQLKKVIVRNNNTSCFRLYLSKDTESELYITQGTVMQIRKIENGHLEIGPYIGMFVNQSKIELLSSGKNITEYIQAQAVCKSLYGLCCFFSINNIDWDRKQINALIRENLNWTSQILPLPKIIYDRNVENNCRVESIELRKRLKNICKILNPMVKLAKWETIKAIEKNPGLVPIIPATIPYENSNDLINSLKLYPSLYLKPDSLSKGKGIFRISKNNNEGNKAEYRTTEGNHIVSLKSLKELENLMRPYSKIGGGYIIQQEINKAKYKGNPFDFRALFQKSCDGIWQLSGIAGRIAGRGSIITSPRSGGTVENLETILMEVFNESFSTANGLYENIVRLGREICLTIEKEFGDCIELGLDMTIDIDKKIWLIEVNGKPLKVSLKRLDSSEVMSRCNKRPIEYAVKLAGFVSEDTH
ncbi:YheC/YheD family protein [Candidatus Clostridium stratigraminis]|uniref:YheC/YheD family protein n=1 Tax=Candidatus Clostridium stratigraminis TaxID=3381661 RepID=A0ABW8T5W4_9CLOT